MERDDRRVTPQRVVLGGHLNETGHRLPIHPGEFELMEPGGRRLGGIERRAHLTRQTRDRRRVPRLLVGHPFPQGLAGRRVVRAEVVAEEIADAGGGEGELQVLAGRRGPLKPTGERDRQRPVGREVGFGAHPLERREPIERGEGHLRADLVEDSGDGGPGAAILEAVTPLLEEPEQAFGRCLAPTVGITGLPDRLDGFGRGLVGGEALEDLHRQGILARPAAQSDLVEEPDGRQFPQAPPFFGEVLQRGEVTDDTVELAPRLLVTLRLEEQPHDPQPFLRTRRIGLSIEHQAQLIARDRSGRQAHVEEERVVGDDPLDPSPARGDLGDPLDDIDPPGGRRQGEDAAPEFVERRGGEDPADRGDAAAVLRDALRDLDPLELPAERKLLRPDHAPPRDERSRQFVIAHEHGGAGRPAAGRLGDRVDGHSGHERKPSLERPAIRHLDPIGQRGARAGPRGEQRAADDSADGRPEGGADRHWLTRRCRRVGSSSQAFHRVSSVTSGLLASAG